MEKEFNFVDSNMVSEVEITYKAKCKPSQRPEINDSKDCYDIFLKYWDADKIEILEQLAVLYLNKRGKVLGLAKLFTGGIDGTVADPRIIMVVALKLGATSLVLAHSHPSGCLTPSTTDISLTQKIKHGGEFLDIMLHDHIIISTEGYYSFADDGVL
jgi:DNA repair protein RadC